jgi:mRNA interferase RelE/StbE
MLNAEFSSHSKKFLKKVDKKTAIRIIENIEGLLVEPFSTDVKRVINRPEKVFRIRVGDYRIQYCVFYENNLLFISDIDKRPRAY